MGILAKVFGGLLGRKSGGFTITDLKNLILHDSMGAAGISVTPATAEACATVFVCVRILSEVHAQLPFVLFERRDDETAGRAYDHPLYDVLHAQPNGWQTPYDQVMMLERHRQLYGQAFLYVTRGTDGRVLELLPMHPGRVTVSQDPNSYALRYQFRSDALGTQELDASRVVHLRLMSDDGINGFSPLGPGREAIALARAAERWGALLFRNGGRAQGFLKHPAKLKDAEARNRLRDSIEEQITGENLHRLMVLEEGLTWEKVSDNAEDSQLLETRKYQKGEIAALYRIPQHMIGNLDRATHSNIEHQSLEFVIYTLVPLLESWEQRFDLALLSREERRKYYCEHIVDGLLRGDKKARAESHALAIVNGWMTVNEVRRTENLAPKEGGDVLRAPLNMADVSAPVKGLNGNGHPRLLPRRVETEELV